MWLSYLGFVSILAGGIILDLQSTGPVIFSLFLVIYGFWPLLIFSAVLLLVDFFTPSYPPKRSRKRR